MNVKTFPRHIVSKFSAAGFTSAKVLVVGDLMLDRYISGEVTRISPEAPVPVLSVRGERNVAGGACNVALNVAGLGSAIAVAGVIGDDVNARRLKDILSKQGVNTAGMVMDGARPTTTKSRVVCDNHQIVRLDEEDTTAVSSEIAQELLQRVVKILDEGNVGACILSDYAKGVLTVSVTQKLISECTARNVAVFVDPKRADYTPYSGATCITPNKKEFKAAAAVMGFPDESITVGGQHLRDRINAAALLVTQGADGMTLMTSEFAHHFPALAEEVFDVSGAGDTVIATVATAFASGLDLVSAVHLSSIAASIVVRRAGTTPIEWRDLYDLLTAESPLPQAPAASLGAASA